MNKSNFILFIFLLFACKKETTPTVIQTIKPGAYYPAYPGSNWTYISLSTSDTFQINVNPEYQLSHYKAENVDCMMTDYVYVPFIGSTPYYGYSIPKISYYNPGDSNACKTLIPFFKESIGGIYGEYHINNNHDSKSIVVTNHFDSILVQNIVYYDVYEVTVQDKYDYTLMQESKTYYAKNVGVIKSVSTVNLYNPAIVGSGRELISYYINN